MARKSDAIGVSSGSDTIIGSGVSAKGSLISETDITIDGTFTGDVKAGGNVTLGVNAVLVGNIKASNVWVAGHLEGNITASGEAGIAESGEVKGDISATMLSIASGAIFIGTSSIPG